MELLTVLLLLQCIGFVASCGGGSPPPPPPCSWTTCRGEWRNDWSPGISNGRCTYQSRRLHHITSTHHGKGSCPAPSYCSSQTQGRTKCEFDVRPTVNRFGITSGLCLELPLTTAYNPSVSPDGESPVACNLFTPSLPSSTGSCVEAYSCPWHAWSGWSGSVPAGTCKQQSRYRDYNQHSRYVIRDNNCNSVSSSCGNRAYGYRTYCSCRYVSCSLGGWSAWYDLGSPVDANHCASEQRKRTYGATNKYVDRVTNCNGVSPLSCPQPVYETREKVITCAVLAAPTYGSWDRADCSANRQRCKNQCRLRCDVANGFQMEGSSDMRVCQSNGQWSTPWNSFCKDVRPPSITCPQEITTNNDPGKGSALVTLPNAITSDNSGKAPTVTTSARVQAKSFCVGKHSVVYTATDEAGNKATCTLIINVIDAERPRISSCPSDIKQKTNKNEVRVTWDYPTFEDNVDKPPSHPLRITSNRNPGQLFSWGRYLVSYQATDRAANSVKCEFYVEVGPVECTYFEAPKYGVRACNIETQSANGVKYEMACTIQCKSGYGFPDPMTATTYLCQSEGTWTRLMYGGLVPVAVPKSERPWPDCAAMEGAGAAEKNFMFYTGSCEGNSQETLEKIRQNFLDAVKNSPIANQLLCTSSQDRDCVLNNVKVYCGSKSKRSGDSAAQQIVTFDFMIKDRHKSSDPKEEAARIKAIMDALDKFEEYLKQDYSNANSAIQVQGLASIAACETGKVRVVVNGSGSELERTACVDCAMGTFYDIGKKECSPCPVGQYQDQEGQSHCKSCPQGTWTVGTGAKNATHCLDICMKGEYSSRDAEGLAVCLMCPLGTYQDKHQQSSCNQCPPGKTTKVKGAVAHSECR